MKEWLLKDEKAKVGRPKLASDEVLKKAKITLALSFMICVVFMFSFFSNIKNENPFKFAYHLTFEKLFGALENKDGFIVKESYDKNYNYVMNVKVPASVDRYSGSYKYTLYEMNGNSWKEKEIKEFDKGTKSFKVTIDSLKNQNKTWKIKLQIINGAKITKSYAPSRWNFTNAEKNSDMYASKVFTVKGYYSPVTIEEIKEAKKSKNKVTITTEKANPRNFILDLPDGTYDVKVKYTDMNSKNVILADDKETSGIKEYNVPNVNKSTLVTFKIYSSKLDGLMLSNWTKETDKDGKIYITNTYVLKPERAYRN